MCVRFLLQTALAIAGLFLAFHTIETPTFAYDSDSQNHVVESETPKDQSHQVEKPEATGIGIVDTLMGITALGSVWVLWLLVFTSVLSLAIIFERLFYFYSHRINFDPFLEKLTALLNERRHDEALKHCEPNRAWESQVVAEALRSKEQLPKAVEKTMASYLARQRTKMDQGLTFLGTLGNNAPFIGLFGTVLGIIQAFRDLAINPAGGPSVVMAGISEALIATAVGLFVAIPAVIAFNWFQRIISRRLANVEATMELILKHYAADSHSRQNAS